MAIDFLHHINLSDNEIQNVKIDNKTTTQRDDMTAAVGHIIYNTTAHEFQFYQGSTAAWVSLNSLSNSDVRALFSANDVGGDGTFSYDSSTGQFSYTGPSAADVRAHFSAGTGISITDGSIASTITQYSNSDVQSYLSVGTGISISNVGEISSTITQYANSDARGAISVTDSGGDGELSYNSTTGVISYTGPSAADVRAHFSAGTGITITDGSIASTITQYGNSDVQSYLSAGTGISISNVGEISSTITQYTDTNAQAAITGGTGVTVSSGEVSIGQAVATTDDVTFNNITADGTLNVKGNVTLGDATSDTVTIKGNLSVEGTTVTVNQTQVNVQNAFVFEGATEDQHETTLSIVEPTQDRTIELPDADGTIALVSSPVITLSGDVTGSGTMTNLGSVTITTDTAKNKAANTTGPASTANNFTFNHNLSTTNVIVQAYKSNKMVMCEVEIVDANNVKLVFAQNQNANDITVNVLSAAS